MAKRFEITASITIKAASAEDAECRFTEALDEVGRKLDADGAGFFVTDVEIAKEADSNQFLSTTLDDT